MAMVPGGHKASKCAPEDFISSMPDDVVANILDRLPIQEAVRTSMLSRNWRSKWIMLSQLVFDFKFFRYLEKKGVNNYGRIISRLLFHLEGVITKFKLQLFTREGVLDDEEINNWILFLSRNGIKDLTYFKLDTRYTPLPTHVFSCRELTHLNLKNGFFSPPARFQGFPNLLSLEFSAVEFESGKLVQFFTKCPILEILNMGYYSGFNNLKVAVFAELTNLKMLTLHLSNLDDTEIRSSNHIFELVGFLPKLQELHLDFERCKPFTEDDARNKSHSRFPCLKKLKLSSIDLGIRVVQSFAFEIIRRSPNLEIVEIKATLWEFRPSPIIISPEYFIEDGARIRSPSTFPSLRTLKLSHIDLGSSILLSFAYEIVRSSPNLQTLEIGRYYLGVIWPPIIVPEVDYNAMRFLKLRTIVFSNLCSLEALEGELCLIKYLLACSPFLEKITVRTTGLHSDNNLELSTKLRKLHRASPVAEIIFRQF